MSESLDLFLPPDAPIFFTSTATGNCAVQSVQITGYNCLKFSDLHSIDQDKSGSAYLLFFP